MRRALVVIAGLVLLAIFMVTGRALIGVSGLSAAAHYFIPVWFGLAVANVVYGLRDGGSARDEIRIFAVAFAVPAVVALLLAWKLS